MVYVFTSTAVYAANTNYGQNPALNLVAGGNNVFYGIANSDGGGGGTNLGSIEGGAVYSWNPATNSYAALVGDIPNPAGTPVVAGDGSFYVLSSSGWLNPNGALYHVVNGVATEVRSFNSYFTPGEGANPNFITMVPDGRIYGTTLNGGLNNYGTIFVYNPKDNTFSSPISFNETNGRAPYGLTYANGYLYGVTAYGGATGQGTMYKYDYLNNNLTLLHSFSSNDDLSDPQYPLTLSNDGNTLMGTAFYNGEDLGGGTFSYNIMNNTYNIVWYGSYYQATPPVQAQDGTWYQSAVVPGSDGWDILAFEDGDKNIIPTVVFTGPNSTNNHGRNYQNIAINGLAYNSADNSLIATQQWGGANSLGYIEKFTPIGTASITGTDVYDFAPPKNYITVTMSYKNITDDYTSTLWAMCLPSRLGTWTISTTNSDYLNLECHASDTSVILGLEGSLPGYPPDPASAKYTYNILDVDSVEHDYVALENSYVFVNFNYDTGTKNVNFYKTDSAGISNNEYIKVNVAN